MAFKPQITYTWLCYGNSQVYFWSEVHNTGVALWYPDIIIHAIMRQEDREAIYCQLGEGIHFPAQVSGTTDNEQEDGDDIMTELYFIPANGESCTFRVALPYNPAFDDF